MTKHHFIFSKQIAFISLSVLFLFACKKKEVVFVDLETTYFAWEKGRFVEYDVTYMFHDSLLMKHDTIHYQIKTLVGDTIIDNSGRVANEFIRYQRTDSTQEWQLIDVWTGIIADGRAELVEENQRVIKMVFKPTADKIWDMNIYNNSGTKLVNYIDIAVNKTINGLFFGPTVTVEQEKYKTLIDDRYRCEVYAKNVGVVYKEIKNLLFKFGSSKPIKGEEYYYRVSNYGKQ